MTQSITLSIGYAWVTKLVTNIFHVSGGYGLDWNNPEMYMPGKTPLVGEGLTAPQAHVLLSPISA